MTKINDANRDLLIEYFGNRCVRCGQPFPTIHEIVPRSLSPKNWESPNNRVALCYFCHDYAHHRGTKHVREELSKLRTEYNTSNGTFEEFLEAKNL